MDTHSNSDFPQILIQGFFFVCFADIADKDWKHCTNKQRNKQTKKKQLHVFFSAALEVGQLKNNTNVLLASGLTQFGGKTLAFSMKPTNL